ncbi:MAG: hypothetical protein NTY09_05090 [bacterium]|nr:hypothetical protein [bacterium]
MDGHHHDHEHEHDHEHGDGHDHMHKMKKMILYKIAHELVMRCYPEGQLTYDQVKEAAERIHEVKHLLKGKKEECKGKD